MLIKTDLSTGTLSTIKTSARMAASTIECRLVQELTDTGFQDNGK